MKIYYMLKTSSNESFGFSGDHKLKTTLYGYEFNEIKVEDLFEQNYNEEPLLVMIDGVIHRINSFSKVKEI